LRHERLQARAKRKRDSAQPQEKRAAIKKMSGCECKRDSAQRSKK
jgi:hypothetical protein